MKLDIDTLKELRRFCVKCWWPAAVFLAVIGNDNPYYEAVHTVYWAVFLTQMFCTFEIWRIRKYDNIHGDWRDNNDIWKRQDEED